jgi:1-acyl-sn-glycerol-3-phosphate acyltransferase
MMFSRMLAMALCVVLRLLTGAHARWTGCAPEPVQRIYCANHTSHIDFLLLWSSLPPAVRCCTRPVAAAEYWKRNRLRRYLIHSVFRGVLVDRRQHGYSTNPLEPAIEVLQKGESLIFFPEGTRGSGDGLLPLKSGIYHLARAFPDVQIVPVWIDNAYRILPKGFLLPVPLLCSMTYGAPLVYSDGERKDEFLERLTAALYELRIK